jgi:RNA polymerase primary sigma factor
VLADETRYRLVLSTRGFVIAAAREHRRRGVPFEDLLNEGNLGLIEAARRFDPARGVGFATYAMWWVHKRMRHALAERSAMVRLPEARLAQLKELRRAEGTLRQALGRNPSRGELSQSLELPVGAVDDLLRLLPSISSLDAPVRGRRRPLADSLPAATVSGEERLIRREMLRRVLGAFERLPPRQKTVLALRLGLAGGTPRALAEVGERLGLTGERVRQIERRAYAELRARLGARHASRTRALRSAHPDRAGEHAASVVVSRSVAVRAGTADGLP